MLIVDSIVIKAINKAQADGIEYNKQSARDFYFQMNDQKTH